MISNYFKMAFRVFMKNGIQTLINIFGLAIGISFSIVIFLYAHKEINFDRFHEHAKRIYRVAVHSRIADNTMKIAVTSTPLARTAKKEIPEVEEAVRVARFGAWLLRYDSLRYNEDLVIFSDPGFFKVFSFPLIYGDPDEVLSRPYSIVLCEKAAKRYFGDINPVGKRLRVENDSTFYMVTGVMKDVPENSHLHFEMVGTLSTFDEMLNNDRWVVNYLYTYLMLRKGADLPSVQKGLQNIVNQYVLPDYADLLNLEDQKSLGAKSFYHFNLQPLTEIHLESEYAAEFEPSGKYQYVYILIALAAIILILSCLNFVNLITSQSAQRVLEVGIRKISGSERRSLVIQFLMESSLLAFLAMALALFITELTLPAISAYIGLNLSLAQLFNSQGFVLLIALIAAVGIFSGLYPAWYLSSFDPRMVMRNKWGDYPDKGRLRIGLSFLQLFLAVAAVAMTSVVIKQYRFLINKDRGYDTENLIVIRRPDALAGQLEQFKKDINAHPDIIISANANVSLGSGFPRFPYYLKGSTARDNVSLSTMMVSHDFDKTYKFRIASGRFFTTTLKTDSSACVINETAAREFGITDPLGKTLIQLTDKPGLTHSYTIIGVVKDFYFETLENRIRPLVMTLMPGNFEGYLTVRIKPDHPESTIHFIKQTWERYTTAYPFVYYYLDQDRRDYYKPVQTTARIFLLLSVINVLMACLSLLGLVSYFYHSNQHDVSIRKTMGASSFKIFLLRASSLSVLIVAASALAWIAVLFLAHRWLNDYAYHIKPDIITFISAMMIVAVFAFLTVYYHTCKSACANPGDLLRQE